MSTTTERPARIQKFQLDRLLNAIDELPSIPETLFRVLQIVDDPRSSAQSLADVIRFDAPLTAKILRLANSPFYNGGAEIPDMRKCIGVLGFRTVRQVAICISVASCIVGECRRRECSLDYRQLWRHCVNVATIAKHLALSAGDEDPEEIFTAGLLHDLGKFVCIIQSQETYERVLAERKRQGRDIVEAERDLLGFDHTMAGQAFGMAWRFPRLLRSVARRHHDRPGTRHDDPRTDRVVALVALSDHLAYAMDPPECDLGYDHSLVDQAALHRAAGFERSAIESESGEILDSLRKARAYLDIT